jgi:nucleoside-diphosphate-sugar epimerase
MRVFIAEASSAIGSPVVAQLVARGHEIIGTDVDSTRHLVTRARNDVQERRPRYFASRRQREELAPRFKREYSQP